MMEKEMIFGTTREEMTSADAMNSQIDSVHILILFLLLIFLIFIYLFILIFFFCLFFFEFFIFLYI